MIGLSKICAVAMFAYFFLQMLVFVHGQHWDLLTELLICWDCLDLAPTHLTDRAWTTLMGHQREDGACNEMTTPEQPGDQDEGGAGMEEKKKRGYF